MRTGRLSISRGHQLEGAPETVSPRLRLVQRPAEAPVIREPASVPQRAESPPVSPDYFAVHDRLAALERLTRLRESKFLSAEEFAAEKALILALPADEILLCEPAPARLEPAPHVPATPARGASLIGRMLGWKFLLFSLSVGLAFSYAAQPNVTARFLDQSLRAIGV